jgi:hypothetical protein
VWNALKKCEVEIKNIKLLHQPKPRSQDEDHSGTCGCWTDADCPSGFHCNTENWMCEPGPPTYDLREDIHLYRPRPKRRSKKLPKLQKGK